MDEKISLSLSTNKALAPYEWLAREEPSQHASGAEQRALWDIEAQLESEFLCSSTRIIRNKSLERETRSRTARRDSRVDMS